MHLSSVLCCENLVPYIKPAAFYENGTFFMYFDLKEKVFP
jgi:hypothetical protein